MNSAMWFSHVHKVGNVYCVLMCLPMSHIKTYWLHDFHLLGYALCNALLVASAVCSCDIDAQTSTTFRFKSFTLYRRRCVVNDSHGTHVFTTWQLLLCGRKKHSSHLKLTEMGRAFGCRLSKFEECKKYLKVLNLIHSVWKHVHVINKYVSLALTNSLVRFVHSNNTNPVAT